MQAADNKPRFDPWKMRTLREARGLTGVQVSQACGWCSFGFQQVSRFESYAKSVGKVTLQRLCKALDCKESDLLSTGPEWRANKAKFEAWKAGGRCDLGRWLLNKHDFSNDGAQLAALGKLKR